jgi:hypothetical protein
VWCTGQGRGSSGGGSCKRRGASAGGAANSHSAGGQPQHRGCQAQGVRPEAAAERVQPPAWPVSPCFAMYRRSSCTAIMTSSWISGQHGSPRDQGQHASTDGSSQSLLAALTPRTCRYSGCRQKERARAVADKEQERLEAQQAAQRQAAYEAARSAEDARKQDLIAKQEVGCCGRDLSNKECSSHASVASCECNASHLILGLLVSRPRTSSCMSYTTSASTATAARCCCGTLLCRRRKSRCC